MTAWFDRRGEARINPGCYLMCSGVGLISPSVDRLWSDPVLSARPTLTAVFRACPAKICYRSALLGTPPAQLAGRANVLQQEPDRVWRILEERVDEGMDAPG